MQLGFTGTQRGMTGQQKHAFGCLLVTKETGDFHEGDCIGSDFEAATIARGAGWRIIGHPPLVAAKRAFFPADVDWPAAAYLDRNKNIVNRSQEMIATPGEFVEQLRSGTWSTIRYARRIGRPCHVILPDGRLL